MSPFPLAFDALFFPLVMISLGGLGAGILKATGLSDRDPFPGGCLGRFLAAAGIGYGAAAGAVLLLASLHLLDSHFLWGLLVFGVGTAWIERRSLRWNELWTALRPIDRWESALALLLALRLGYHWIGCWLPVFGQDELTYHLLMPRQYLLEGGLFPTPHLLHGNFPFNAEMIYTLCLNFGSETLAKQVQWGLWVILHLALIGAARTVHPRVGYLTALLYAVPVGAVYLRAAMEAGSDAPTAFCLGLALYFLLAMDRRTLPTSVVLAAVMNGLAWGTKYVAPVFVTPLVAVTAAVRLWEFRASAAVWARTILLFAVLNVALFAPWMIKNAAFTGNPIYPLLTSLFPSPHPYDDVAQRLFAYERISNFYLDEQGAPPDGPGDFLLRAARDYITGKQSWPIYEGDFLLILFVFASLAGLFVRDGRVRALAAAGLFAHVVFFFIYGAHINRFFSVTYPLAALLVGILGGLLLVRSGRAGFWQALIGLFLLAAAVNLQLRWNEFVRWNGLPMFTQAAHDQYRRRFSIDPDIDAFWKTVPRLTARQSRILGHGVRYPYFLPRRIDCICDFEDEILVVWLEQTGDWEKVAERLREEGYTHMILSPHALRWSPVGEQPVPYPPEDSDLTDRQTRAREILWPPVDWLDRHTRLLHAQGGNELREILPRPPGSPPPPRPPLPR